MTAPTPVKVVIPIYSTELKGFEEVSLCRNYQLLQNYPLVVVKPRSLDLSGLLERFPKLEVEAFDDEYFRGIRGYNRLMMSPEFYERFSDCEYILICQLDAFIFRDELKEWCSKGYDYVGAPWPRRPIYDFPLFRLASWVKRQYCRLLHRPNSQVTANKVGNGGLSLRKVSAHLRATQQLKEVVQEYLQHPGHHLYNEDVFFSIEVNQHGMNFTYPDYKEAFYFSFDKHPAYCYKQTGGTLPFGCHSWYKKRMKKFWFPIIFGVGACKVPLLKSCSARLKAYWFRLLELMSPSHIESGKDIPIVINNFNRLTTLRQLIASLEKRGLRNIYILDNDSTYPPLLDYYKQTPYEVIYLHRNVGFKALWKASDVRHRFCKDYYIYTDSDVVLDEACPDDVVDRLLHLLKDKYKCAAKIGLSLRIDDLPDCYAQKSKVIEWESRFYKEENEDYLFRAPVDTTIALYRPRVGLSRSRAVEAYRTAAPYRLKHLPWYMDSKALSEEEAYYIAHCSRATAWSSAAKVEKQ